VLPVADAVAACRSFGLDVELMHTDCFLDIVSPPQARPDLAVIMPPIDFGAMWDDGPESAPYAA
jgi:hypothetical protein